MKLSRIISYVTLFVTCFLLSLYSTLGQEKIHSFQVTVDQPVKMEIDSLFLLYTEQYFGSPFDRVHAAGRSADGLFHFTVHTDGGEGVARISQKMPPSHPMYGSLYTYLPFIPTFNWEAGDDLRLTLTRRRPGERLIHDFSYDYTLAFSGRGSAKCVVWQQVEQAFSKPVLPLTHVDSQFRFRNMFASKVQESFATLENEQQRLSPFYYMLFKVQIMDLLPTAFFYRIRYFLEVDSNKHRPAAEKALFRSTYFPAMDSLHSYARAIPDSMVARSRRYIEFLYQELRFNHYLLTGQDDAEAVLRQIGDRYKGEVKDKLLLAALQIDLGQPILNTATGKRLFNSIRHPACLAELDKVAAKMPGYPAYNFSLTDTSGRTIRLQDLKGKVVFMDFWFTGCGACSHYYESILKEAEAALLPARDIVFVSICVDKSKARWLKSIQSDAYTSVHALNLYTDGGGTDNGLLQYYDVGSFPQFLIVDKAGRVYRYYKGGGSPDIATAPALVNTLKTLAGTE